jgi:MFS transporter, OFA family, oxalate/formate antiporter
MQIAGFLLLMLLYGAMYSFPALSTAMAADLGTSRTALQGAVAIWALAVAALSPLVGRSVDRQGLRRTLILGLASLILMLAGLGLARAPWQVYAVLIDLGALAHSLLQVATLVAASRTGARRRGNALGLAGAGIGSGLAFLVPGTVWVSGRWGWRAALLALGGATAVVGLPAVLTATRDRAVTTAALAATAATGGVDDSFASLLRSPAFLLMFGGGIMIGLLDEALYQHLVPHLQALGLSAAAAGTILGCASLGYIGGQVVGGSLSDHQGRWGVGVIAALLAGAGLAVLGLAALGRAGLLLTACGAGAGIGGTIAIRSAALADLFDGPALGLVTGTYQWSYAIGAAVIGWAGAYVDERLGSYQPVFVASAAGALVWLLCLRAALALPARARGRKEIPA